MEIPAWQILGFVISLSSLALTIKFTKSTFARLVVSLVLASFTILIIEGWVKAPYHFPILWNHNPLWRPNAQLLFVEEFTDESEARPYYVHVPYASWHKGRIRFSIDKSFSGDAFQLPGQYENFLVEFDVYPVGDIFDASINVLARVHDGGWYEIQIRPNTQEVRVYKIIKEGNHETMLCFYEECWLSNKQISLGKIATHVMVEAEGGKFTVWIGMHKIITFVDEQPFLRGSLKLGAGAGENAGVIIEFDSVKVWSWAEHP